MDNMKKLRRLVLPALIYVVLVETCAPVPVSENPRDVENSNNVFHPSAVSFQNIRRRRASHIIISKAIIEGIKAVKRLSTGATKVPTDKKYRKFEKPGDFGKAVQDFEGLLPNGAHDFKMPDGVSGKAGRVGDRLLVLRNKGDSGKPTITIMKIEDVIRLDGKNRISGRLTDEIIYKD